MSTESTSQKYRIYHRWHNFGGIDVEDAVAGSNCRLHVDWLAWLSRYRFEIAGRPATVQIKETFGTATVTAVVGDRQICISSKKKLIGKESYEVADEAGPRGTLRPLNGSRLLLTTPGAEAEISEIRNLGSVYWIVEAPGPVDPLLLAAIALIVRNHGTAENLPRG